MVSLHADRGLGLLDLVALLELLSGPSPETENFQYYILLDCHAFGDHKVSVNGQCDTEYAGEFKIYKPLANTFSYRIYSNKDIEEVIFILNDDSLTTVQGTTGPLYDPDTLDWASMEGEFNTSLSWKLRLSTADGGTIIDTSGISELEVLYCVSGDAGADIIGFEINFPLILKGPVQRFNVVAYGVSLDTFMIDLNQSREDSVLFTDIDTLVSAINRSLETVSKQQHGWSVLYNLFHFSPAINRWTSRKENRLMFIGRPLIYFEIIPEDGNEKLLKRLGYPKWLRDIPPHFNWNYKGEDFY